MKINLTGIKIKNFKSIKNLELPFLVNSQGLEKDVELNGFKYIDGKKFGIAPYSVLFGRNSIGKTSILEAISFVSTIYSGLLSDVAFKKTFAEESTKIKSSPLTTTMHNSLAEFANAQNELSLKLKDAVTKRSGEYFNKYNASLSEIVRMYHDNNARVKKEAIEIQLTFFVEDRFIDVNFGINGEGLLSAQITSDNSKYHEAIIGFIQNIGISSVDLPFNNLVNTGTDSRGDINNVQYLSDLSILIKNIIGKKKFLEVMQLADPEIKDFDFNYVIEKDYKLESCDGIFIKTGKINMLGLSTGTRHFLIMFYNIISRANIGNTLVLIDELELSLHKELIDSLKLLMEQMFVKKNVAFIFTTHSPLAVYDYTSFKQIVSLTKNEDGTHLVERLSSKFKQHQNIINRYIDGDLSPYPDVDKARNTIGDIIG